MPGYFSAMGIPLLEGRDFNQGDTLGAQQVMILSKRAADVLFPQGKALGKQVRWGAGPDSVWSTIIGVVGNTTWNPAEKYPGIEVYWSYRQWRSSGIFLIINSVLPADAMAGEIRQVVAKASPDMAVEFIKGYDTIANESVWQRRLWSFVLSAFALLALALTAIGLYGVLSYMVSQQTRDLGIRLAIGAQRVDVFQLVIGSGMRIVAIGSLAGLTSAYLVARVIRSILFGVSTWDSVTYALIVMLVLVVSMIACLAPAIHGMSIDPMVALRDQ